MTVTSQKCILQVNPTKPNKFQNKVYNLSHSPAPAFTSAYVYSTIIAVYKTTRKTRVS